MTERDASHFAARAIPRRDQVLIVTCILLICAVAWAYLVHLNGQASSGHTSPTAMAGMAMSTDTAGGVSGVLLTFIMWAVMMVGMMGPSAAPTLLLFAASQARRGARGAPTLTLLFGVGYLTIWLAFSVAATVAHWALDQTMLLSSTAAVASRHVAGALCIGAGVYQLTPLKRGCLQHCQSPVSFLMSHWRDGRRGAFQMGLRHGMYCLGCCWALMALLFAVGVMNLMAVALLTVFILAERVGRGGTIISRVGGVAMISTGVFLLLASS
jgi:predicted metal-binding membrane protein